MDKNNLCMKVKLKFKILIHIWKDTLHLGIYKAKKLDKNSKLILIHFISSFLHGSINKIYKFKPII